MPGSAGDGAPAAFRAHPTVIRKVKEYSLNTAMLRQLVERISSLSVLAGRTQSFAPWIVFGQPDNQPKTRALQMTIL
jgi:hypothetical protein